MKNPLILIIPAVLISIAACKKLGDPMKITAITHDESAMMIAGSLASGSNGLVTFSDDIAKTSQKYYSNNTGCGVIHNDTISHHSLPGSATGCNFKQIITSKLNCNANRLPDNVTSTSTFSGSYDGPRLSASGTGNTTATIAGLTPTSTVYAINGQLKNTSNFKLKSDTTRRGTIAIDIVLKNLIIAKATATSPAIIKSGTATVTITGNSTKGAFLFEGTLTFAGYNEAILALANNNTYSINLSTGAIIKK